MNLDGLFNQLALALMSDEDKHELVMAEKPDAITALVLGTDSDDDCDLVILRITPAWQGHDHALVQLANKPLPAVDPDGDAVRDELVGKFYSFVAPIHYRTTNGEPEMAVCPLGHAAMDVTERIHGEQPELAAAAAEFGITIVATEEEWQAATPALDA